ncbi:MAG: GNAT family N-acetyltransferase [Myxococcota bacterium]
MPQRPTLYTARLVLRPFALSDADEVQRLAGDERIAATTLNVPHPYEDGMAEAWISTHQSRFDDGTLRNFAVTLAASGELVGAIGLAIDPETRIAELGYWVGVPHWGNGYCTEAARAVVRHGWSIGLQRIHAHYMATNVASGRVMEKVGMTREGTLRQHVVKHGVRHDMVWFGILAGDHDALGTT